MHMLRSFALALVLVVAFALPHVAFAQGNGVKDVQQRLTSLETTVASLQQAVSALQTENAAQSTLLQSQASAITALESALTKQIADSKAYTDSMGASTLASAKTYTDGKVAPVADKLVHFSRNDNEVYITGANLNLRNGTGFTYQAVNGLGNLIVGYNELRTGDGAVNTRTGSHNVILGFGQDYSRAGAFMSGGYNTSSNHFASVIGGTGNTSGGLYSVVVGGYDNQATGNWSTVLGGQGVRATTQLAHVP